MIKVDEKQELIKVDEKQECEECIKTLIQV